MRHRLAVKGSNRRLIDRPVEITTHLRITVDRCHRQLMLSPPAAQHDAVGPYPIHARSIAECTPNRLRRVLDIEDQQRSPRSDWKAMRSTSSSAARRGAATSIQLGPTRRLDDLLGDRRRPDLRVLALTASRSESEQTVAVRSATRTEPDVRV